MKKGTGTGLWRGLTSIFASLMALCVGTTSIVNANIGFINVRMGTTNYVAVHTGDEERDSYYFKSEFGSVPELVAAKEALAEQIAEEGSVLFKNENAALPMDKTAERVTLWGLNSHNPTLGGRIGSSANADAEAGQISWDIEASLTEKGFTLNADMIALYSGEEATAFARKNGHSITPSFGRMYENGAEYNAGELPARLYTDAALASADGTTALVVLSRDSSEAADYHPDMVSASKKCEDSFVRPLAITENERAMLALAKQHSTKVIVLINAVNPMEIEELKQDPEVDAILWVGEPGINGFPGVADVLSGDVCPSGHISDTYAVSSVSAPSMVNFGVYLYTNNSTTDAGVLTEDNKGDWYLVESEGIYNGYKYYETRYADLIEGNGNAADPAGATAGGAWSYADEVSYAFGYGLSYTTFSQKLESVEVNVGGLGKAVVTVQNTGSVAGRSTVQLYVSVPYTAGGLEKSAIQLVGFGKTAELQPGESATVEVEIDPTLFASYDENVVKADGTQGAWVLEAGDYVFSIGNGAHEALNNVLASRGADVATLTTLTAEEQIVPENACVWTLAETDCETYSANVENRLQDADINKLIEGTVEYTTRSDWSKGWTPVAAITPTEAMMIGLTNSNYTLTENGEGVTWGADNGLKLVDMLRFDENGTYTGVPDIDDPIWDQLLDQIKLEEAIQFIEKGGDDVENIDSIGLPRNYANDGPLGFAHDQVAGYYVRWRDDLKDDPCYVAEGSEDAEYSMTSFPTEPVVAATFDTALVQRQGELFGEDGLWSNESSLFSPGSNLHRSVYCARNHEYYSEDPVLTSLLSVAQCVGGESKGLMMEAKHFAFNHQESNRSGLSTFFTEQAGRENELRCFRKMMQGNYVSGVMTAFNRVGTVYAGACRAMLTDIARTEWGYLGWYNTDMMNGADYMNWRDITAAGGGNCLTTSAYDTSIIGAMQSSEAAIAKDTAFQQEMKQSLKYWMYQIADSNVMNGLSSSIEMKYVMTWYQKLLLGCEIGFGVLALLCAVIGLIKGRRSRRAA